MNPRALRTAVALLLEAAALALLALVVVGRPWPQDREAPNLFVLADRSASIAVEPAQSALADILSAAAEISPRADVHVIEFAGQPRQASGLSTDIAAAIDLAIREQSTRSAAAIVVLSDGIATSGNTRRALRMASESGVPVLWRTVQPDSLLPRIVNVVAPTLARTGQDIPVSVQLAGASDRPLVLKLSPRDGMADPVSVRLDAGRLGAALSRIGARTAGTWLFDVQLSDESGRVLDAWRSAAMIDVEAPAGILFVADGPSPFAQSLQAGGWQLQRVESSSLDGLARQFARHAAVVIDDVPASAARSETWAALGAAVRDQGTGLLVLGGPRSFAAGSYRNSPLESLLPVESRPAGLADPAAIAFVVDKSGSMGASSAGVNRFRLAQRAVVETAAALGGRDSAALVVFDAESRVLLPLQDAVAFREAVAHPWAAQPRGGTQLIPALGAALTQLAAADARRRLLVLVTDGFIEARPDVSLRSRLSEAGIELIALGVGPDADMAALQRLFPEDRATFLRVGEAAELPAVMRQGLESRRAPIERGRLGVRELRPLPFLVAGGDEWPAIAAYDVTTAAADAIVHLESSRGDPVVAQRRLGLGRVVAVTSGLGSWTPEWLRWRHWPALAGGLAEWVSARDGDEGLSVDVQDSPGALRAEVDIASAGRWADISRGDLWVKMPSGRVSQVPLEPTAPGRLSAVIDEPEDGPYLLTVRVGRSVRQVAHLRQPRREFAGEDPNPEIADWQAQGLVRVWSTAALQEVAAELRPADARPGRATLLALALFMLGLFVERKR